MALGQHEEHHARKMSGLMSEKLQCRIFVVSAFDVFTRRAACID